MTRSSHEELRATLAAYLLNAVTPAEQREIGRHLDECEDCRREARLLGEAAAELSFLAGEDEVDPDLVDRVLESLPRGAPSRRMWSRPAAWLAAAAVVVTAALGPMAVRGQVRQRQIESVMAAGRAVAIEPLRGFPAHGSVFIASDKAKAFVVLEGVPAPQDERTYQIWALEGTTPHSVATFVRHGRVSLLLDWPRAADRIALTVEPRGGSRRPTTDPVLAGA